MNKRQKKKLRKHSTPKYDIIPRAIRLKYSGRIIKPRYKQLEIAVIRKAEFLANKFANNARMIRQDFVNEEKVN